ncbi:amphi-Trp domain-containing protein [Amycolatopsis carbonis]|uniref:Amphi-Trp domain-containing protein n=1 Tax=Amycolatopsis carbonis TaxID=715471 RepID=A0A9Y2IDN0_9PSEU|nr:amphi-Trp domain-containing protein [Amycolatopsis sp. 2-15]WIX77190.1 amphi-Trp domain-containing protein [Amycolatopsis sp. 2-15]
MSEVEVKREEKLSREDAAQRLAALAAALAAGGKVELALGASTVKIHVPDEVEIEVEIEIDGGKVELEVELKWSTGKPARAVATRRTGRRTAAAAAK